MSDDKPAITVVALCYNHERYLIECLNSIRDQTCQDFQLIVTDDCSSDRSQALISDWLAKNYPDAVFIRHDKNLGICKTLNQALAHARGRYLSMIATDDVWLPEKLAIQLAEMEASPSTVGVLYSDAYQMDDTGAPIDEMFISSHFPAIGHPEGQLFALLAQANFIPAMTTLIRMECFAKVGKYDEGLAFEDWDMWLRIATAFDFQYSRFRSARYRIVPTSLLRTMLKGPNPARQDTYFQIKTKCLESGLLPPETIERFKREAWDIAFDLYTAGYKGSAMRLFRAYRLCGNRRAAVLAALAFLGISHKTARKIRNMLPGIR